MFKKLLLAGALIALPMMFSGEEASAFGGLGIGIGHGYGYGHGVAVRPIAPYHSVHRHARVVAPYPVHRGYGYGGVGYGGVGYGGAGYGGAGYGYGRSCAPIGYGAGYGHHHHRPHAGISLRFGF